MVSRLPRRLQWVTARDSSNGTKLTSRQRVDSPPGTFRRFIVPGLLASHCAIGTMDLIASKKRIVERLAAVAYQMRNFLAVSFGGPNAKRGIWRRSVSFYTC